MFTEDRALWLYRHYRWLEGALPAREKSDRQLGFSLGVFCVRNGVEPRTAGSHLKANPGQVFAGSLDFIDELEEQHGSDQPCATDSHDDRSGSEKVKAFKDQLRDG